MRKRFVTILLTAVLAAALASCGSASNGAGAATENQVTEDAAKAQEDVKAESAKAELDSKAESTVSEAAKAESEAAKAESDASSATTTPIKPELIESEKTESKKTDSASKPEETAGDETKKSTGSGLGDYDPDDVSVSLTLGHSGDNEYANIVATYNGKEIWNKTTGSYPTSQLDRVSNIGKYEKRYYYVESGAIVCVDLGTGDEIWRNYEFGGSPAKWASGFGGDGTIFVSGYLGPDLFVCSSDGKTVKSIGSFRDDFYWPYELTYYEDANLVKLVYEMSPYGDGGELFISLDDYTAREEKDFEDNSGSNNSGSGDGQVYYPDVENYLSLRTSPSTDAPLKNKIYPGTPLIVLGYENGMAKVRVEGTDEEGYVNANYIKPAGSSSSSGSSGSSGSSSSKSSSNYGLEPGMTAYANVKEYLSLREGPSTSSNVITTLPDWTEFTILDYPEGKMVHVRVEETGQTGYVHVDFLSY